METMNQYFSYNKDYSKLPFIFGNLYRQMRVIHDNGMYIPVVNSNHILVDTDFSFDSFNLFDDTFESNAVEVKKRENIVDLTKLFLGTYLSLSTNFRDFSFVDTEWFLNNIDDIMTSIDSEEFYPEYFSLVFMEGRNVYYDEFYDKKIQEDSLTGKSNRNEYKKVLSNAGSKFYQEQIDNNMDESFIEKKSAYINFLFYPTLMICSFIVCFVIYTCFKYIIS